MTMRTALLLLLAACTAAPQDADTADSDTDTDAACVGEACDTDDAPALPDAVDPEPNDRPDQATPVDAGEAAVGRLGELDVDCWAVDVPANGWFSAQVTGPDGTCPPEAVLRAYDDSGAEIAVAVPEGPTACVTLGPAEHEGARYLDAGRYAVCVEGLFRTAVPAYRLVVEVGDDSCLGDGFEPPEGEDPDGDKVANACDSDDDGDGYPDHLDTCPLLPNAGTTAGFDTAREGYVRQWLVAGPFTGKSVGTGGSCAPTDGPVAHPEDDGLVEPAVGDAHAAGTWALWMLSAETSTIDFTQRFSGTAPHEALAVSWVWSDTQQEARLAYGADDGSRAWLNGVLLGTDPTCHGVSTDGIQHTVTLESGWNRLAIRVRDHGGGFGLKARFKTTSGAAITTLAVSPSADGSWAPDQTDSDGDGLGDVCDPTP